MVVIGLAVVLFALAVLAQTHPGRAQLPVAPRLRSGMAGARRDAIPAQQLAPALVRRVVAALLAWRQLAAPTLAPFTAVVATGGLFLVVVFSFTNARHWVTEQTTINRATLHIAPLVAVFAVLAFRAFAERWSASRPAMQRQTPCRRRRDARPRCTRPRMLELPGVTLVCADTANHALALRALAIRRTASATGARCC